MKYTLIAIICLTTSVVLGQSYTGKEDLKFQVGANFQENGTGILATLDYGLGENISLGVKGMYLLGVEEFSEIQIAGSEATFEDAAFGDRFDLRLRFNAHLGNVINLDENFDIYPGLDLGLKNFGGHLGLRYFFSPGFGIFSEFNVPFAKYKQEEDFDLRDRPRKELNNQFNFSIGASFNL